MIGAPVWICDVTDSAGDLVLDDCDGVMIVPAGRVTQLLAEARARDAAELANFERLRYGGSTIEIYRLPAIERAA